ncbi:outer membrane receptor protein involved in Fe transport [Dyadobacter sp. BE34]|uniref:Outer membrane receptor protein involved in Fe transport n=1 Tax=Dyadobacter fermentans TaxID=94254 RepID=A0ABU1R244_9BACT|nr:MULTISPECIES: outer membrane beta-barrel family protein [Dyadobacter]MDR6807476.1 outer membrane receptor protein involved in Fe transport [Dyadobacter fermentans]MDR7045217.1 outer membrane receptor protein involved in Fe transport [Dyadobacter sp. BE242]MDR7199046.1 outer membrane receptor protein involved in Fe transport [Dyadobacter sp. BE34]MDR7217006.1 outer membrane receptor protein involved in Fe transport [Dyadobacter sp. BE31]MDR7264939.1 outer membrane receptor protein involved i
MKKILLLLWLCLPMLAAHAQTGGRFTLKGTVTDTSGTILPEATIMLLLPKDSSLVNFGRTAKDGSFEMKNLKRTTYIFKVSYVGYVPYQEIVDPKNQEVVDIGKAKMKVLQKELYEVVIKTARAPLSIRGDTVEFDAKAFKVPPGSSVEDLLRKLPGVQVDGDGNIRAQGEEIKRVTVDGKRFFGDDPKMATKNLPAEAINKVQVFNGKTEQAKATGVDDGKREKTMNLELKDSHKKGGFGKAVAGVGTDSRLEGKVSYNRFDEKQQFAVLGFGNNTNQSGIARNDYQDFKGSQSFNWGDDGDFGFSSGRYYGGDDITIQPNWGGQGSEGFTKNWAGGANYNFDTKKTKLSTSYFYNSTRSVTDVETSSENFLTNDSYITAGKNKTLGFTGNHRPAFRFEHNIDSLNTLILISNSRINGGDNDYSSETRSYRNENMLTNRSDVKNLSDYNSFAMANLLLYRHKFKKKGRNFAASVGYNINNSDEDRRQNSVNLFLQDSTKNSVINQLQQTESTRGNFKGSLSYVEPFAKKFFWETFYNYSMRKDKVDRDVFDVEGSGDKVNPFLTRYYTNDFTFNRLGTSVRYSHKGLNLALGLAGVQFDLKGKFALDESQQNMTRVDRTFKKLVPNVSLNYSLKNNKYLYAEYGLNVREPSITDLQPIVDNSNPLYIVEGNPDLIPQTTHNAYAGFNMFNPASFTNLYINAYYNYNEDQIVYNRTINADLVTTTKPMNISGGNNYGTYIGFGFPLKKTKATFGVNTGINFSNNLTYINNIKNETSTDGYNFGARLDLTPSDVFTLYTNANWNISETKYSINTNQNQKILNANYNADMNVKMPKEIYFNGRLNYRTYKNDQFGFNQQVPILTLSVYKLILKNKKGEIRLTANDVFKRNLGISQNANQNYYSERRVATLSRYFMLSFTYNMRGMSASVKRSGFY